MKLIKPLLIAVLLTKPALAADLSASTYLGLQQAEIKANYKCAPTFLALGGGRRMICRGNDSGVFTFILQGRKSVVVEITPNQPELTLIEALQHLESQCEANKDTIAFTCEANVQGSAEETQFGVTITLCEERYCPDLG